MTQGEQAVVRNVFTYFKSYSASTEDAIKYTQKAISLGYTTIRKYCVVQKDRVDIVRENPQKAENEQSGWLHFRSNKTVCLLARESPLLWTQF